MSLMNYRVFKRKILKILTIVLLLGGCANQPSYQPAQPVTPPEPTLESMALISNIALEEQEGSIRVIIKGSEPLSYEVSQVESPLRLIIDVAGAKLNIPPETIQVDKGVITNITPSELEKEGKTTSRIEVGLNTSCMSHYEVLPSGNDLFVDFPTPEPIKKAENVFDLAINEAQDYVQVDILADGPIEEYKSFDLAKPTRLVLDFSRLNTLAPVKEKQSASPLLKRVRCAQHPDYFRVVFDSPLSVLPAFEVVPTTKGVAVFLGTGFEGKKAELVTIAPSSPSTPEPQPLVATAPEKTDPQGEGENKSALEVKEAAPKVGAAASSEVSSPEAEIKEQSSPEAAGKAPEPEQPSEKEVSPPSEEAQPSMPAAVAEAVPPPRYTGTHISLDFKDADIRNILRLIAEVSNLNVVAGDDVQGTVTIKLHDVPWDQALDVILLSNNLGKTLDGNILRIAPREKLEKEKQSTITSKEITEKMEPLKKGLIPVSYAQAKELRDVIKNAKVLSPRGTIEIDDRTNTMIVMDIERNIEEVKRIIEQLDTPTPQVLIEAKIVQINPTYTKELGITWESGYTTTSGKDALIGIGGQGGVSIDGSTGTVTTKGNIVDLAPAVGPGVGGAISFGYLKPGFGIFQKIAALEKEEKIEIISSPRIMTLDNQEAVIEQGVDLPYLKLSEQGVTSTEFKKATLSLKVIPHVTADGSIVMEIEAKKDQKSAQTGAGGEPGIDTRRAATKVLVRNGNTVVIGGIYEETSQDINNSIPYLGRIPILNFFFKGTTKKREKVEMIVFITPTIIQLPKKPPEVVTTQ